MGNENLNENLKEELITFINEHLDKKFVVQLLLLIGIFDDDTEMVQKALEHGADINRSMTNIERQILTEVGYVISV